jgi:hypothetical protein
MAFFLTFAGRKNSHQFSMERAIFKFSTPKKIIILANWSEAEIHGVNSIPLGNKKKALAQLRKLHKSIIERIKV